MIHIKKSPSFIKGYNIRYITKCGSKNDMSWNRHLLGDTVWVYWDNAWIKKPQKLDHYIGWNMLKNAG